MTTIKATGQQICTTRKELADKYFQGFIAYAHGNSGMVAILSDVQHMLGDNTYYRNILNDIKSILMEDERQNG